MNFEAWWKKMKPAECDEVKQYFEECWNTCLDAVDAEMEGMEFSNAARDAIQDALKVGAGDTAVQGDMLLPHNA